MTTQAEALDRLIAAVEAGEASTMLFDDAIPSEDPFNPDKAELAYLGSIDAARWLHDTLLPDRAWGVTCGGEYGAVASVSDVAFGEPHRCQSTTPARAWLLAILRAYREALE